MMNNYKKHLFSELGNHLYRMKDKERSHLWSSQAFKVKSEYIQGFFDFYLKDLNISPKDLMEAIKDESKKLIETIYSIDYQKIEERKGWIELFQKHIVRDPLFFAQALKECLSSHGKLLDNNYYPESVKNSFINENKEIFKNLLSEAKEFGAFKNINQKDLMTSYILYKNIMEQENIFKSDFSFSNFMDCLSDGNKNDFFKTYIVEIIDFLQANPEKLKEIYQDKKTDKFVSEILTISDPTNLQKQSQFISDLIKVEEPIRISIGTEKKLFHKNFIDLVPLYFDSLMPSENQKIFNENQHGLNNRRLEDQYGHAGVDWLGMFLEEKSNGLTSFEIFNVVFNKQKNLSLSLDKNDLIDYSSRIQIAFIDKQIESHNYLVKNGLPGKKVEIINYMDKNLDNNAFLINHKGTYANKSIDILSRVFNFIENDDNKLHSLMKKSIKTNAESIIKEIFSSEGSYRSATYMKLLSSTIDKFNCPEVLKSVIENGHSWEKEVAIEIKIKDQKTKQIYQPFAFTILEMTSPKTFEWFLNSPQLDELVNIKHKNKGIIEHLCEKPKFNDYLNILSKNTIGFKKLVLNNKKTFKKLSNSENENIKKTTMFLKIEDNLPTKEMKIKPLKI